MVLKAIFNRWTIFTSLFLIIFLPQSQVSIYMSSGDNTTMVSQQRNQKQATGQIWAPAKTASIVVYRRVMILIRLYKKSN